MLFGKRIRPPGSSTSSPFDRSTLAPVQRVVDEALAKPGGLDILVNNAGTITRADALGISTKPTGMW